MSEDRTTIDFDRHSTAYRTDFEQITDFACDPAGAVHYDTTGIINGMKHLPATFTPGARLGPGLDETIAAMQRAVDTHGLAEPVTRQGKAAHLND